MNFTATDSDPWRALRRVAGDDATSTTRQDLQHYPVARRPREPRMLDEPSRGRQQDSGRPERSPQATLRGRAPPFPGEDEGPHCLCDIAKEEPKLVALRRSADRSQPTIWAGRNK